MDNKLDKYFKDQLHDREFDFKDSYWAGAQRLLDEQERRRRRGLLFRWVGGLSGLALLVAGFWFYSKHEHQHDSSPRFVESDSVKPIGNMPVQENENKVSGSTTDYFGENIPANLNAEKPIENVGNSNSKTAITGSNNGTHTNSGTSKESPLDRGGKISGTVVEIPAAQDVSNENEKAFKNEKALETGLTPNIEAAIQALIADEKSISVINEAENKPEGTRPFDHLDFLDLRQIFVEGDFMQKSPKVTEPNRKAKKSSPFSVGVMAVQLFQLGAKNAEKTIIGYQGGLVAQYRLKGNWYIGSGLQYRYRTGTFDASKSTVGRNYRFGLETDTFVLRPSSLHYLSVPIQLGWQKGRNILETGVALDYLMGMRGEKGQYERTEEPPIRREFQATEKGWLVEDGFQKLNAAAMLAYRYRVSRQLSVGLSANYAFGGILKKDYETPTGGFRLKEADKFYLDLRAVYLIK